MSTKIEWVGQLPLGQLREISSQRNGKYTSDRKEERFLLHLKEEVSSLILR
jgi:hypothetical protein